MRLRATLAYDGTDFHGWQLQPEGPTIQRAVESALATIVTEPIRALVAGRTDSGVHARGQVIAFDLPRPLELTKLLRSLNGLVGPAIVVRDLTHVDDRFDPRRDARSRCYEYRIDNGPYASPFTRRYTWHVRDPLDAGAMAAAAAKLTGEHDFSAFQAADCDAENAVREVIESSVATEGEEIVYRITATAFLRHMVRAIAGTLVQVGRGDLTPENLAQILAGRDRAKAGETAPARGLCLVRVRYEAEKPVRRRMTDSR